MANLARLITASSLPAAGLLLTTVKAAEKVHPSELDIYDKPSLNQEVFLEEPSSDLEKKISGGRKQIIGYWGNVKDVFGKGQSLAQSATVKTSEFMELISSDQTFQIKVAVISSGVLVGAIAAGRGRRPFRRLFYSAGLGSIAFSACYPQKAWVITKKGAEQSKVLFNKLKAMYDEQKQKRLTQAAEEKIETKATVEKPGEFVQEHPAPTLVKIQEPEPPTVVLNEEIKDIGAMTITGALDSESDRSYFSYIPFLGWFFKGSSSNVTTAESMVKEETQTPLVGDKDEKCGCESSVPSANAKQEAVGDHGQSNPEDKDMYSTRE